MRIVQLISSAGLYGAEKMMLTLAWTLTHMGHDCTVVVFANMRKPNLDVAAEARTLKLPVEVLSCSGRIDRGAISQLRAMLGDSKDILHTHGYKADLYGYFAGRHTGVRTVSTCHNWIHEGFAAAIYNRVDRIALRHFDAVIAVSADVAEILRRSGVPRTKVTLIANGIDVTQFSHAEPILRRELNVADEQTRIVGYVGRLSDEKGVHHLLRAAALVLKSNPTVRFVLAGDGPARSSLEKLANELEIAGKVVFLGQRSDIAGVYASCDVIVMPSLTEGLPLTLLEALASGCAVVATAVGAIPQVMTPEETGLLVAPGDSQALAATITRLLGDAGLRRQLGQCGRRIVAERHSAEAMAARYCAVYREVLGEVQWQSQANA